MSSCPGSRWKHSCKTGASLYVTGKGGVGKTTVAAALGLAAAEAGRRTIVCEVAEQDRVSRAFRREGVAAETEVAARREPVGDHDRPAAGAEEWLAKQLGGGAPLRMLARSHAFQYFVAAAPGAKELITIAKVWELAQLERWDARNRTYDLVVVDAPASGHGLAMLTTPRTFGEIARVGPDPPPGVQGPRRCSPTPSAPGYVAVALPEEMPVNETLELERRLPEAVGLGLEAIVVNGVWPERFSAADVKRAARRLAQRPRPGRRRGRCAPRSPSTSAPSCSAATSGGSTKESGAKVVTLPYLFESELGLPEYELLADELADEPRLRDGRRGWTSGGLRSAGSSAGRVRGVIASGR